MHWRFRSGLKAFSPAWTAVKRRLKRLVKRLTDRSGERFWNSLAPECHARWGVACDDYPTITNIIRKIGVRSVLDVGCGSGRLFDLYNELGLEFTGTDLSAVALAIARRRFPASTLIHLKTEKISFHKVGRHFDLAISNRSLQHIAPHLIRPSLAGITEIAAAVYTNDAWLGDGLASDDFLFEHDYDALFSELSFEKTDSGSIDDQHIYHWSVYQPIPGQATRSLPSAEPAPRRKPNGGK
jgi:SAM-dependent methyltransferase